MFVEIFRKIRNCRSDWFCRAISFGVNPTAVFRFYEKPARFRVLKVDPS